MLSEPGDPEGLPVAGVMQVQYVGSGESNDPEANHKTTDCEHPFPSNAVVNTESVSLPGAKNLAADADCHKDGAERECEPSHRW